MAMHRINRSEVELHTGDAALARALLDRIGRIYGPRIAPVVDRVCSGLNASEAPIRIDRLEVDLGTVAADDVEGAFVARLEPALRAALQEALPRRTGGARSARDSLELLETFALTGGLPWWAPPDREVVARHFARASAEAGAELMALLGRIAQDPGALERLTRLCGRSTLAALVQRAQADQRRPAGSPSASPRIADEAARHQQPGDPGLLDDPRAGARPIGDREPASNAPAVDDAMAAASSGASRRTGDELRRQQHAGPTSLGKQQARVSGVGDREPTPSSGRSAVDDATAAASSAAFPGDDSASRRLQPAALTPLDEEHAHARDLDRRTLSSPGFPVIDGGLPRARPAGPTARTAGRTPRVPAASTDPAAIGARRRGALGRLDELYVEDAGLVILWPFLERFFVRTGVLGEDRRFLDAAAQLQAVALVASLATADPAPLEFRLPLAKLLCGRPLESDFALDRPLTPEQLAEADRLLAAVIDRVPALGEPSIAEFRAGFLARPAALGARDGAWLLQVERRPDDPVLDRFPWSWRWVRLPWMGAPLRVEW